MCRSDVDSDSSLCTDSYKYTVILFDVKNGRHSTMNTCTSKYRRLQGCTSTLYAVQYCDKSRESGSIEPDLPRPARPGSVVHIPNMV